MCTLFTNNRTTNTTYVDPYIFLVASSALGARFISQTQLGVGSSISSKIESELGLRQNQMVIKMDVLTTSDYCCEPYLGLSDIRSAATNQIYLLLRADLNCNGLLCVRIKTAGLSQQCGKAINSK